WLSQWYFCPFRDEEDPNKVYFTAEHYMMYHKALLFKDAASAHRILTAKHPRQAKDLGRKVSNFSESTWREHREAIVRRGNLFKFTRAVSEAGLKELLLATGETELVEASPFDPVWGIGYKERDAENVTREDWGLNLLGKALMDVRTMLRRQDGS
ncbi:DUF1768-domain-containing protein, partial [Sodiomyces alkalinus F11]